MTLPNQGKRKIFDGRYEIISIVGRGADSVVYHARHVTGTSQEVAIKVLTNRAGAASLTDQLRKEALTLVSCRHKYVVRLDDFHSIKDLCYLSMEYAPLGDLLKYTSSTNKRLSNDQAALFLRQALEALDFIHATGVIHRDLKPENILVINDKEIRIADFGLALLPGDDVALDDLRKGVGSFDYLAPEVLDGVRYDTLSDLYSLGVCFYEAVSGVHPFRNAPLAEQRNARLDDRITPLNVVAPSLPPHIAAVIASLIRFNSEERIQSASDAVKALANHEFRGITAFTEPATSKTSTPPQQIKEPISVSSTTVSTEPARVATQAAFTPASTEGSTARAVATTAATASVQVAEREPANSDTLAGRPVQPTEKIDLERVKAIIAKDTQRRSIGTTNSTQPSDTDTAAGANPKPSSTSELSQKRKTHKAAPAPQSQLLLALWDRFSLLPTLTRSVLVAGLSALVTIGGLLTWHSLSGGSTTSESTHSVSVATHPTDTSAAERARTERTEPLDPAATTGMNLSRGIYSGVVRGLLPGADIPIALISRPGDAGLVLALGVEGWVPTAGSIPAGERAEDTATFRSNGLVLSFERELSSTEITGTVTDMVTGDTGVWVVTKHS
jgi:serine/threonine protein kinase